MTEIKQLPHLMNLVDDDSTEVRKIILKELDDYGLTLETDLYETVQNLDGSKLAAVRPIIEKNRREWLKVNWSRWFYIDEQNEKLEDAMELIGLFQYGFNYKGKLSEKLDPLSEEFKAKTPYGNEIDLSNFLFQYKKFMGDKEDYHNPLNSNLFYTLETKKGLPISLTLIYMLVAHRLGLTVRGCNFPGHFLAKIKHEDETYLVDCFNSGKILFEHDIKEMAKESYESVAGIIKSNIETKVIIRRVINNLINSYKHTGDKVNSDFFTDMLNITPWTNL